jgi:hypothetical protein
MASLSVPITLGLAGLSKPDMTVADLQEGQLVRVGGERLVNDPEGGA